MLNLLIKWNGGMKVFCLYFNRLTIQRARIMPVWILRLQTKKSVLTHAKRGTFFLLVREGNTNWTCHVKKKGHNNENLEC